MLMALEACMYKSLVDRTLIQRAVGSPLEEGDFAHIQKARVI
jgi:hypothetical protein